MHTKALNIEIDVCGYGKHCLYCPILLFSYRSIFKASQNAAKNKPQCNFMFFIAQAYCNFSIDLIEGENLSGYFILFALFNVPSPFDSTMLDQFRSNVHVVYFISFIKWEKLLPFNHFEKSCKANFMIIISRMLTFLKRKQFSIS